MSFVCPFSVHLIYTKFKKKLFISNLINKNLFYLLINLNIINVVKLAKSKKAREAQKNSQALRLF